MKKACMNISHFHFLLFNLKIISEIVTTLHCIFSIKYRQNGLLLESFIELPEEDFMIYQLVNTEKENLNSSSVAIVTSHIANIRNASSKIIRFLHC